MTRSELRTVGEHADVLTSDVLTPDDVAAEERLLSVAEIQLALRGLRTRRRPTGPTATDGSIPSPAVTAVRVDERVPTITIRAHSTAQPAASRGVPLVPIASRGGDLDGQWVGVVDAHAGAGASTVALAIADAAAATGRLTHLVETAHPSRSGLLAAANAELGLNETGTWRRGTRARLTIDRRAGNATPPGWPALPPAGDGLVVVDLGQPTPANLRRLTGARCRLIVVCKPTVPGVRRAEQLLTSIADPVGVATVGGGKWPPQVTATVGPRLRGLCDGGRVVAVAYDRHLQANGPTTAPLPKAVLAAGRALLALIDAAGDNITGGDTSTVRRGSHSAGTRR